MDLHIGIIPAVPDEDLRALFVAMLRIDQTNHRCVFGHCDLASGSPEAAQVDYLHQDDFRCHHLVAMDGPGETVDPDAVVGYGSIWMSMHDNLDTALVGICVHPEARSRGVGSALLAAVEDLATGDGRSVINTWSLHAPEPCPTRLRSYERAVNGPGRLRSDDPAARFFLRRGYALDQTHSTLQLDLSADWKPEDQAGGRGQTGYQAVGWEGGTPAAYVLPMARLRTLMSTAAPAGSIEREEQRWDAERVHRYDDERSALGLAVHTVAALTSGTGELVGYTELTVSPRTPALAVQGDTFVAPDHRGHQLGWVLKVTNLAGARHAHPLLRRVITTNAGENAAMRAINHRLGFREVGIDANWQKVLGDHSSR